ncbi:hypothetical protein Aglo01_03670 [Actinokineospora globicatena]|nr:hypothetical protein Aglo01_03670 [Actinokineospora globicatena]GLW82723.1 hypothetical protein Aglo02_03640 [Actinokineospora globicatena]
MAATRGSLWGSASIFMLMGYRSYPHVDLCGGRFKIDCRWVPVDWPRDAPRRGWGLGRGLPARAGAKRGWWGRRVGAAGETVGRWGTGKAIALVGLAGAGPMVGGWGREQ